MNRKQALLVFFLLGLSVFASAQPLSLPPVAGELQRHVVVQGESLYRIARDYDVGVYHLMRANGLKSRSAPVGEELVIPRRRIAPRVLQSGVVVNLPERTLYYFENGEVADMHPIAVGSPYRHTPTGEFKVISRVKWPTWMPPKWTGIDHPVPPGPRNPLGKWWMGLNADGIGLHSTNAPGSIGWSVSGGCMRNYPENAEKLAKRVYLGMPVYIINDPIKIGYRRGQVFLEVHENLYNKNFTYEDLRRRLKELGLDGLYDESRARQIFEQKKGYAVPLIGEEMILSVNGLMAEEAMVITRGGVTYVDDRLFRSALGLTVEARDGEALVYRHPRGPTAHVPALSWRGASLVPYAPIASIVSLLVLRDPGTHAVNIVDPMYCRLAHASQAGGCASGRADRGGFTAGDCLTYEDESLRPAWGGGLWRARLSPFLSGARSSDLLWEWGAVGAR